MNFQPVTIGVEPCPYVAVFVVRRVVLNEHRSLPSIAASQLFQEREVRGSVEGVRQSKPWLTMVYSESGGD